MMNTKLITVFGAATLAVSVLAGNALAENNSKSPSVAPAATAPFVAPYAQAAAWVGQNGTVISKKGFTSTQHPIVGVTCLELPGGISNTTKPTVTVEWATSLGVALFAQLDTANIDCVSPTPRTVSVRTYKGDSGGVGSALQTPVLSDQVSFIIVVP